MSARFYELNHHLPKLQLLEIFPMAPFLAHREGMVSFDVGANIGLWSEGFLKTYGSRVAHHHMFEPLFGNQEHLEKRQANALSRLVGKSTIHKVAVGPTDGETVSINYDEPNSTLASVVNAQSVVGDRTVELANAVDVPQISLDAEIERQGIECVDLLKIDVEGYEMPVLQGAENALKTNTIRVILFEFGAHQSDEGEMFRDFYELLSGFGYQVYKEQRGRNFYGFAPVHSYNHTLEPDSRLVEMVLATVEEPSPSYWGPRVIDDPIPVELPQRRGWFDGWTFARRN